MTAPLLEAREVRKQFGAVVAADSISARVHRGEIIGVIGANGAGKTTFVNMLTGHLAPDSGDFFFEGKNITGMPSCDIVRAGINRSFQISQVFSEMSVADNLAAAVALFGGEGGMWRPAISADVVRRAEELMRRFAIEEWRSQTAATLPQGARKCLDIAMAMAGGPSLALLDEPTSGVSAEEKLTVMDGLMAAMRETKSAVLFVEHDMEIVSRYAERVWAFVGGRIVGDGPAAEVLASPEVRRQIVGENG